MTSTDERAKPARRLRVLVAGATGYIGRFVVRELVARRHDVVGLVRPRSPAGAADPAMHPMLAGADLRQAEVTDYETLLRDGVAGDRFDAVVSCIASRSGGVRDAWRVDYDANRNLLAAARAAQADHFVLLSALCVQRPVLAFQHAKLAFEAELRNAGMTWSIVRPTAFFKSVAGQVPRVQAGKAFLMFGQGDGPACKPIAESDLASFIADCLARPSLHDRVLPIGGPGPAMTVRERGELLFELSGRPARFRRLPLAMFGVAERVFAAAARWAPRLEDKAEFARIGRYYATEPMLALHPETGQPDASATPEYGTATLRDFYRRALRRGLAGQELGDHALF